MTPADHMIPAFVDGQLRPVEKLKVHQLGLKHPAVSVFILGKNKVLMQRRALGKYHTPGLWTNTCCTHPHWNEDPMDCAVRRLEEELGLTGVTLRHAGVVEYRADVANGLTEHEVVDLFTAEATLDLQLCLNANEVAEVAWRDLDELSADLRTRPELYTPWMRIYMRDHRDMILGATSYS